jgi:hypothetical protein
LRHLGDWAFSVFEADNGDAFTDWAVYDPGADYLYEGTTNGALPWAVLDAYDHVGLTCPLVVEPDLAHMSGLSARKEDE